MMSECIPPFAEPASQHDADLAARNRVADALGLGGNGLNEGRPVSFAWGYLLAAIKELAVPAPPEGGAHEALRQYADPDNWVEDEFGVKRVWMEPDSSSPMAYDGFTLAAKALAE